MSRTDAHRPWPVQLRDPDVRRRCLPSHLHWIREDPYTVNRIRHYHVVRTAPCDLWTAGGLGRCRWFPTWNTCGCPMCTGRNEVRAQRRRDRYAGRRECRQWRRGDLNP